ncbi:MAG: hypothetical protein GX465_05335, partial [Acidobacteria bacterium]|nr:hypothetical protein [Acidobacteriota bacterium]
MTSKERLLTALARGKPDRLPATVHQWQGYHLETYMDGRSDLEAFAAVGLDAAVQFSQDLGNYWMAGADFSRFSTPEWRDEATVVSADPDHRVVRH